MQSNCSWPNSMRPVQPAQKPRPKSFTMLLSCGDWESPGEDMADKEQVAEMAAALDAAFPRVSSACSVY